MSKFLAIGQFAYVVISVVAGISAFGNSSIGVAISGILCPIIAWFGGAGLRGALATGDRKQKITGIVAGMIFLVISLTWINYTNYGITLFDMPVSGPVWCSLGFLVGLILTTKSHAENKFD